MESSYFPRRAESKWYEFWETLDLFRADPDRARQEQLPTFSMVLPPPNITGKLTIGHVLNATIQDVYARWKRMQGYEVCWIPGTDHAGIATQTKVAEHLSDVGVIASRDLTRDEFIETIWDWERQHGTVILEQLQRLGVSADWSRKKFTMDPGPSETVQKAFIRLFESGLIYRDKKIVNWSPSAQTVISDEEVVYREMVSALYIVSYELTDGSGTIEIATVRPETIPGDAAIAVHPEDERYRDMVGKMARVPMIGREIPVIADEAVDPEFGTGALKVTPGHDPLDYEIGCRHGLPVIVVIDPAGNMTFESGPLFRLERSAARYEAEFQLEQEGRLVRIEEYTHSVGFSERGGEPIEPYLTEQWFLRMKDFVEDAKTAVSSGEITFSPDHWVKTYHHWLDNIRDWPISRQLVWGHRIPVYYAPDGTMLVASSPEEARVKFEALGYSPKMAFRQDPDVLDTWFSSWLWPLSVHGWGTDNEDPESLRAFYPNDLLVTGPDIIFFWVARMIMAGSYFMPDGVYGKIPFRHVHFTPIIRDAQGRKLSKSLGNSPDPIEVIEDYGADALRFTILHEAPVHQDLRFSATECELGRNFANKIWNAARFLLSRNEKTGYDPSTGDFVLEARGYMEPWTDSNRWILSRFQGMLTEITGHLEGYRLKEYATRVYEFVWTDFCGWYLEHLKIEDPNPVSQKFSLCLFDLILRVLHPIMPFVTEEIWQNMTERKHGDGVPASIMTAMFPGTYELNISPSLEKSFNQAHGIISWIRSIRAEYKISPKHPLRMEIIWDNPESEALRNNSISLDAIKALGRIEEIRFVRRDAIQPDAASSVFNTIEARVLLGGVVDLDKERAKASGEIRRLEGLIEDLNTKLSNEAFLKKAPGHIIEKERTRLGEYTQALEKYTLFVEHS